MKRQPGKIAAAFVALFGFFALLTQSLDAQSTFVYTNNNPINPLVAPNSVSAFLVGSNGTLTPVPGSPFLTGGNGGAGTTTASSRIAVTTIAGNFLYASNDGSNTISGFSIDTVTGALTPVPGSPFATGPLICFQSSLAVTPDGRFLYAGNGVCFPNNISAFSITSNGALTQIPGSPFPAGPTFNLKVTPDGKFLAVAEKTFSGGMFSIGSNGALTPVPQPFFFPGLSFGLDVNCASNLVFSPAQGQNEVSVLSISSNGVLTPIAGSPFTFSGIGNNLIGNLLSPDDRHLFLSDFGNTITSLNVASGGSLTVSGSPVSTFQPGVMATNQAGTFLYVTSLFDSILSGFSIDSNGALSPVPGSPFGLPFGGFASVEPSVAVFPPKSCSAAPTITSISPTSAVAGVAAFTLTVNGTNFVSGSTVNFNGNARVTAFVSATQLTAAILVSDIATAGTFAVTVTNPGGTTSNAVSFTVLTPQDATQAIINSVNVLFSTGVINGGQDNSLLAQLQHAIIMLNAGKNNGAIGNLDSFITEVNDLLSSGVLSPSQAASLVSAAQSVIAAL